MPGCMACFESKFASTWVVRAPKIDPKIGLSAPGFRPAIRAGLGGRKPEKKIFGEKMDFRRFFGGPNPGGNPDLGGFP